MLHTVRIGFKPTYVLLQAQYCIKGINGCLMFLQTSDKAVLEVLADANLPDDARIEQIVELLVSPGTVRTSAH